MKATKRRNPPKFTFKCRTIWKSQKWLTILNCYENILIHKLRALKITDREKNATHNSLEIFTGNMEMVRDFLYKNKHLFLTFLNYNSYQYCCVSLFFSC